jgi:TQXA domain-containing protein/LPXTG-motif cell wall-anchored protein
MIKAQRQRGRRRVSTVVAALAAVVGLVLGLASPALAASVIEVVGMSSQSGSIHGTWPGNGARSQTAGLFDVVIDGEVDAQAYCIDINTPVRDGDTLDETDWSSIGVDNLEKVGAILRHYHPNGNGPDDHAITGTDAQKAAATQAAIWHYTDGYELTDDPARNPQVIIDNYKAILAAVEGGLEGFGEPSVSLTITPPASSSGEAGSLVGPYTINTTADSVTLTPSDGVALHNEDGSPFTAEVVDGTQVWLSSSEAADGSIAATASAEVGAGRAFFTEGVQRLILASTVTIDATDDAPVTFTSAPTTTESTTTTTAPSTTSTTVPITVQSTVPDAPTTTVPITPNQDEGGGLPVTGAQSLMLVAVAAVLLAVGAGFGIVSRRKRLEGVEE